MNFLTRGAIVVLGLFAIAGAAAVSPFLQVQEDQSTSVTVSNQTTVTAAPQNSMTRIVNVGGIVIVNCNEAFDTFSWVRACIKATSRVTQPIEVKRGSSVSIPVQFYHEAGSNPFVNGVSIILGLTEPRPGEFLVEVVRSGVNLSESARSTPLLHHASFVPSSLTLPPGGTVNATMIINIPSSFPPELVGKKLGFPITWGLPEAPHVRDRESGVWGFYEQVEVIVR